MKYIPTVILLNVILQKEAKWMSLCCIVGYKWPVGQCVTDCIKLEFNDIIS